MSSVDTLRSFRFNPSDLDDTVAPGADFYHYATGGWLKANPIPDDQSRWGIFDRLTEYTNEAVKEILENPAPFAGTSDEALAQKVSGLYRLGMDETAITTTGLAPLQPLLKRIDQVTTLHDLSALVGELHRTIARPLFNFFAAPDARQSSRVIGALVQGGLGLPEREYYVADDERSVTIRQQYVEHLVALFGLAGIPDASQAAERVMVIETALAKNMTTKEELRDPVKNYNKLEYNDVQQRYSNFNWHLFFTELGLPQPGPIDVGQLAFFAGLNSVLLTIPLADWKMYMRACVIRSAADFAGAPLEQEKFRFYGQVLSGLKQMKPRHKRVVEIVDTFLGKAVGKLYVRDNFSPIAKERATQLVANLRVAMAERIKQLSWMGEATKQEALTKLHGITVKVGYPDVWYDYSSLTIDPGLSFLENIMRCYAFEIRRDLDKIGKPTDRTEWLMHPQQVNAYYEPSQNEIVFPAGILQPPFFDDSADDAMNYGGIGAVIGHEISHGFDDQGRQYDATGNLRDWWTADDEAHFKERAARLVEQYNKMELLPGLFVNGQFTLGENIADLGGVEIALDAFMLTDQSKAAELIDGFTPVQRFFISYAQTWKTNVREERARLYIRVDTHSPAVFRTNGPLSNVGRWYEAFSVASDAKMFRSAEERVIIW